MRSTLVLLLCCTLAAPAVGEPLFLSILPAGQDGLVPMQPPVPARPDHKFDQLAMYRDLILAAPGLEDADLLRFFKDASIAPPAVPERVETPRAGVTISRDAFGVPHIVGTTRADVFFGAGYVTAEDRLFLSDALRHIGRGRFSEFAGSLLGVNATLGFDRTYYAVAGHSEDELTAQIQALVDRFPGVGAEVLADARAFVEGMNTYIAEARSDPTKMPLEYSLPGISLEDWRLSDVVASTIAFTTVIGFGNSGGGEHRNVVLRQALEARFGPRKGLRLWQDLRAADDPEAPVSSLRRFPYLQVKPEDVDPAAVAIPDPGSIVGQDPPAIQAAARAALGFPSHMSNFLVVTGKNAAGGHPILVGGPQTGYFAPQVLLEFSLEGGGVNARGATVPGVPYVVLGHTPDYAFTATAGGTDLADVRVERLCDPPGGETGSGTLFNGECRPMYRRVDTWQVGMQTVTATVERTVHGPVFARATVDGAPVVLAVERSNFGREIESGPAYFALNTNGARTPEDFRGVMALVNSTLNWAYVNRDDAAYFHSGRFPIRAAGVDPDLPSWGTGEWEWQGILEFTRQPFEVNPQRGWLSSWNNKPARAWRASDANYAFGLVDRALALNVRLERAVKQRPVTVVDVVDAMADAATVDLRGQTLLPEALALAKGDRALRPAVDVLRRWLAAGAHRRDRDADGRYDDEAAVALMDAWYPRLLHAVFDDQLRDLYAAIPLRFDDAPGNSNLGSAYDDGYYGYLKKVFRQALGRSVQRPYRVLRCADGPRALCAAAVRASLTAAVADLDSPDPTAWHVDPTKDQIEFSIGGVAAVQPIPWQNRPTFQQVTQIR